MARNSAGILLWKREQHSMLVLLVHPGGPFWTNKDAGAWSIPKGEYDDDEAPLAAAKREFAEELGRLPAGEVTPLGEIRQKAGKVVTAFALEGDFDCANFTCNSFEIEWPPKSGKRASFPEIDQAQWFSLAEARRKINPAQAELIDRLEAALATSSPAKSRPAPR
jgi:predicted NUDIX family NTP pyrophosphohydrolase